MGFPHPINARFGKNRKIGPTTKKNIAYDFWLFSEISNSRKLMRCGNSSGNNACVLFGAVKDRVDGL